MKDSDDRFNRSHRDDEGQLAWIDKQLLRVDPEYQRTEAVSAKRVLSIANTWSWEACGTLTVSLRDDGHYYIIDGQHRWLAAMKRSIVAALPCIVFSNTGVSKEAESFVWSNTNRGHVREIDKFKAELKAGDKTAVAVMQAIENSGYRITTAASSSHAVACLKLLKASYNTSPSRFIRIWELLVEVHNGEPISTNVFAGCFYLEGVLEKQGKSITTRTYRESLTRAGADGLKRAIDKTRAFEGRGGAKVCAQGVANLLNKGRANNRIPYLFDQPE